MKELINNIDDNGDGVIQFEEWATYIKKAFKNTIDIETKKLPDKKKLEEILD